MAEQDFDLGFPWALDSDDETEDMLASVDLGQAMTSASSVQEENLGSILTKPALESLPPPEMPSIQASDKTDPPAKKFKSLTDEDIRALEDQTQSNSTKKNTKWDWYCEKFGIKADFKNMSKVEIAERLRAFYCEASPKNVKGREKNLPQEQAREYHKNTLKYIRFALNRHFHDLDLPIDVVRDKEFVHANRALDGTLKMQTKTGVARPTNHKRIINNNDMKKISTYLSTGYLNSPIVLRQAMWYLISIHFVTRGMEFHHQLLRNSFEIKSDENGDQYATLTQETLQKNFQGGLSSEEAPTDRRMYAVSDSILCPIKILRYYLNRLHPNATFLFNHCNKEAMLSPGTNSTWYINKPLSKSGFASFMRDIGKAAGCMESYTPHCLRATAIQCMNDAGHEARHIMFMSGHRSESSIRSYNRECSTKQKKDLSMTLASATVGKDSETPDSNSTAAHGQRQLAIIDENVLTLNENQETQPTESSLGRMNQQNYLSQFLSNSGFMSRSNFDHCTFNFNV